MNFLNTLFQLFSRFLRCCHHNTHLHFDVFLHVWHLFSDCVGTHEHVLHTRRVSCSSCVGTLFRMNLQTLNKSSTRGSACWCANILTMTLLTFLNLSVKAVALKLPRPFGVNDVTRQNKATNLGLFYIFYYTLMIRFYCYTWRLAINDK